MKKALLIAEKPSLRRTIEAVYEKHRSEIPYEIKFMEQRGHLLELKNPAEMDEDMKEWAWETLPFHPEEHGGWSYKVREEKKTGSFKTSEERYNAIKKELRTDGYDFIINAGDPDQEGQLLIWEVLDALKPGIPVKRYWSNDTTDGKVLEALKALRDDEHDEMLVNLRSAGYARQHSDYRVGMNISRAAALKLNRYIACGRVETPIMSMVCRREQEISDFVPETVYGVRAVYDGGFTGVLYEQPDAPADGDAENGSGDEGADVGVVWFKTKEEAEGFMSGLPSSATVIKYETKRVETLAPKLFKLATVQVAAGRLGYTASEVLGIIQGLYERGFLSYPRTDCEYLSSHEDFSAMLRSAGHVPELEAFVSGVDRGAIPKVLKTKKWVNDKKLTESGHSALVPTSKAPDWKSFSDDEKKIYSLVARQFIAIFYPPLVQDKAVLLTDAGGYTFRSTGKTLVDAGYTAVFGTGFEDVEIPACEEFDRLGVERYEVTDKTSTCPKRFTDADLIAACEAPHKFLEDESLKRLGKNLKIGTPATRSATIEKLVNRHKYLKRETEKKATYIIPTEVGMYIYENLKGCMICKVDMTAEWEEMLEMVRSGEMDAEEMEGSVRSGVESMIREIKAMEVTSVLVGDERKDLGTCPECGGRVISGKKSFYCSNWKEEKGGCKYGLFKEFIGAKITDKDFEALMAGKTLKKKLKSKAGKEWEQELYYDAQNHKLEFVKGPDASGEARETDWSCPNCGERLSDDGRSLKCACGFKLWKTVCGRELSEAELDNFFNSGDTGLIRGLKSKAGKEFSAHIVLADDRKGSKLAFED